MITTFWQQIDHYFLATRQSRSNPESMTVSGFFQGYGSLEGSLDRDLGKKQKQKKAFLFILQDEE